MAQNIKMLEISSSYLWKILTVFVIRTSFNSFASLKILTVFTLSASIHLSDVTTEKCLFSEENFGDIALTAPMLLVFAESSALPKSSAMYCRGKPDTKSSQNQPSLQYHRSTHTTHMESIEQMQHGLTYPDRLEGPTRREANTVGVQRVHKTECKGVTTSAPSISPDARRRTAEHILHRN